MRAYRSRYTGEQMDSLLGQVSGKQDALTFDAVPTSDSTNPVTSGGVYTALSGKADNEDIGAANGIAPLNGSAKVADTYLPKYAGSNASGGTANKASSIPFGQVDSTSTSTAFTATVPGITELVDGTCVLLRNGVVTSAAGFTIDINGLGAKPTFSNMTDATRDTTIFNVAYTMLLVYDSTRVVGDFTGAWCCYRGYDANTNTIGYQVRTNSSTLPAKFKTYRYRLLFTSFDNMYYVGANASTSTNATSARTPTNEKINPFGPIVYYGSSTAINADANFGATVLWSQYTLTIGYSFMSSGFALTSNKPVYLKCNPQTDGSAIIDGTTPIVQALPSSEDGKIYIFLGIAYSTTAMELYPTHPVYYYEKGCIRLWTNPMPKPHYTSGESVNRPLLHNVPVGFQYMDLTLGKPVFSAGTKWVDATSTTV